MGLIGYLFFRTDKRQT